MIYNKVELTNQKALELDGMEIEVLDRLYVFTASAVDVGGYRQVQQLTVDGYENNEWNPELSFVAFPGEILEAKEFEWAQFI